MQHNTQTLILGAGISGLVLAQELKKEKHPFILCEKNSFVGGVIRSPQVQGYQLETGPHTLMLGTAKTQKWLKSLQLHTFMEPTLPQARKRYVLKKNQLVAVPQKPLDFITTSLFGILSKAKFLKEAWSRWESYENHSLGQWLEKRFGKDILRYGVHPFVSGIYAGDPDHLSAEHAFRKLFLYADKHKSILKGLKALKQDNHGSRATFGFKNGMETLPRALVDGILGSVWLNTKISSIKKTDLGWQVTVVKNDQQALINAKQLVVTTPACHLKALPWECPQMQKHVGLLSSMEYAPVALVSLGYDRDALTHPLDGFGYLVSKYENSFGLGTLFCSSIFPKRSPQGKVLLTSFVGGACEPERALLPESKLIEGIHQDLRQTLGIKGQKPAFAWTHSWQNAIPQYNLGYERYLETMQKAEKEFSGLHFLGNYKGGIALGNCIENSLDLAEKLKLVHQEKLRI